MNEARAEIIEKEKERINGEIERMRNLREKVGPSSSLINRIEETIENLMKEREEVTLKHLCNCTCGCKNSTVDDVCLPCAVGSHAPKRRRKKFTKREEKEHSRDRDEMWSLGHGA